MRSGQQEVRVWSWRHDEEELLDGRPLAALVAVLDAADRSHVAGLRSARQRASVLRSRAMVRGVLAAELGMEPSDLRFSRVCARCGHPTHGRPVLIHLGGDGVPHFSVSRTGGLIAVAVAAHPVGIDVERLGLEDARAVAPVILSGQERRRWSEMADGSADRLLELWVAKEAYLKGTGVGLVRDPTRVEVSPLHERWTPVDDGGRRGWSVRLVRLGPRWVGALAVTGEGTSFSYRTWPP